MFAPNETRSFLSLFHRLYNKGHTVIGIEGVEKAIVEFFTENNLEFTKSTTEAGNLFQVIATRQEISHCMCDAYYWVRTCRQYDRYSVRN